jgi:hypothetical protein
MPAIKLNVFLREILAHATDKFHLRKKTRRDSRVAGGAAKQARVFSVWSFDGIKCGGADN